MRACAHSSVKCECFQVSPLGLQRLKQLASLRRRSNTTEAFRRPALRSQGGRTTARPDALELRVLLCPDPHSAVGSDVTASLLDQEV